MTKKYKLHCERCNHKWKSKNQNPDSCAKCRSRSWNIKKYNHKCWRCNKEWNSSIKNPMKCKHCQSYWWNGMRNKITIRIKTGNKQWKRLRTTEKGYRILSKKIKEITKRKYISNKNSNYEYTTQPEAFNELPLKDKIKIYPQYK